MAERNTIVVTGASGYIGAALVPRLRAGGYDTRVVLHADKARVASNESVVADLRRPDDWQEVLAGAAGVVHLASRTDLRTAEADIAADEEINVQPVRALIDALKALGARLPVVFASTVTVFGDNPPQPCNETAPDNPLSVYDRHKLACELLLKDATAGGVLSACTLRLANVYGRAKDVPGTSSTNSNRGILNAMMARAARGEGLTVYGAGEYIRDFVHINDVVTAFSAALANPRVQDGASYIIASGEGNSLKDAFALVAREAKALTGVAVDVRHVAEPADLHQSERRNFIGSSRLFESKTGWKHEIDLESGVRHCLRELSTPLLTASGN
jgi:UDP-glucose 4-epimerase